MLLKDALAKGRLTATTDAETAINTTELSLICVGTPSNSNDGLNATGVLAVAREIGEVLKRKAGYHGIAIRSTVMPGTVERATVIIAEVSGKGPGRDFGVASNPEFLREGTAVLDFEAPPFTIVGTSDACIEGLLRCLYEPLDSPYLVVDVKVAELLKYACNSFHAVKVTFANEIGSLCKRLGVGSYSLMNLFIKDCKLNISEQYLKPGFAFGDSCLPKDLRALSHAAKQLDLEMPGLDAAEQDLFAFLSWPEFRELKKQGFAISSHTVEHPIMTLIPSDQLSHELSASKAAIEQQVGGNCSCFVYPNGGSSDLLGVVVEAVRAAGYEFAFTVTNQFCSRGQDPLLLDRIYMPGQLSSAAFHVRASGFQGALKQWLK